jgi:hypothetical protein
MYSAQVIALRREARLVLEGMRELMKSGDADACSLFPPSSTR